MSLVSRWQAWLDEHFDLREELVKLFDPTPFAPLTSPKESPVASVFRPQGDAKESPNRELPPAVKQFHEQQRVAVIPRQSDEENTVAVITWTSATVVNSVQLYQTLIMVLSALFRLKYPPLLEHWTEGQDFGIGQLIHIWPDVKICQMLEDHGITSVNISVFRDKTSCWWKYDNNLIEEEANHPKPS